jgi:hypothetical protein
MAQYGLGSSINGGGSRGQKFTFPSGSVDSGSFIYVDYESTSSAGAFEAFFGFSADYDDGSGGALFLAGGNDAVELYWKESVVDVYGNVDEDGGDWSVSKGWAYRIDGTSASTSWASSDWTVEDGDLEGYTDNTAAAVVGKDVPIQTYKPYNTDPTAVPTLSLSPTAPPSLVPSSLPTAVPTGCPAGTAFSDTAGECEPCQKGTYSDKVGAYRCAICEMGRYAANASSIACDLCPAGTFNNFSNASAENHNGLADCFACPEGRPSQPDRKSCAPCTAGQYATATDCADCETGRYAPIAQTSECLSCPAGSYSDETKAIKCDDCEAGTVQPREGRSSCIDCEAGYYSSNTGTSANCTKCLAGSHSSVAKSASCDSCAVGKAQSVAGSSSCDECEVGRYQPATGQESCTACDVGEISSSSGASECTKCQAGTVQPSQSSTSCDDCAAGRYQPFEGQTICLGCSGGTFSSPGASTCTGCPAGTFSAATASACTDCPAGTFSDSGIAAAASGCTSCDAGKYSSSRSSSCLMCAIGKYASATGSSACLECAAGKYASSTGVSLCTPCSASYYTPKSGAFTCARCTSPETSLNEGASNCSACEKNYYFHTRYRACKDCPEGAICAGNTTLKTLDVEKGYYRFELWSSELIRCPYPNNCNGGSAKAGDNMCIRGAYGPLCELCKDDYFLEMGGTNACSSCKDATESPRVVALFVIVAILLVGGIIVLLAVVKKNLQAIRDFYIERKERIKEVGAKITALIFTMQIIILVNNNHKDLDGDGLPEPFQQFLASISFLALDVVNVVPVGCIFGHVRHFQKVLVWTLVPTAMILVVGIAIRYVEKATTKKLVGLP